VNISQSQLGKILIREQEIKMEIDRGENDGKCMQYGIG
jgi:hypothetical protein